MQTGFIETVEDDASRERSGKLRSSGSGFPPSNNGGGGDGPGDDNKGPNKDRPVNSLDDDELDAVPDKARVITWFLLLVVTMTFGGLIGAYVVISSNNVAEWKPFDLPIPVWISTVLIIISSFIYHGGKLAVDANNTERTRRFLVATTVLGAIFIASQLMAWLALARSGLYMTGNPYAGFFYILTGIHAVHVLGGVVALGAILLCAWHNTDFEPELEYRRNLARSVGYYWHFMGFLWLVLFVLLGFWK